MKHLILLATLFIGSMSFAQGMGDVTIYSNTGDKFYVVLNGIRQNDAPETNVKVTGLNNPWYSAKIISANNNFEIEKNIVVKFDTLVTYRITEKKGKFKLRFYSETSLGTATSVPDQSVVSYHATENPVGTTTTNTGNTNSNTNTNTTITGGGTGMTTTTTTTTMSTSENMGTGTTVNTGNGTETIDINVNVNETGMGANIDMNVSGTGIPSENVTTTTSGNNSSTTTTTSTSTNGAGNGTYYEETTTTTTSSSTNNGTTTYYEETTTTTSGTGGNFGTTTTTTGNGNNIGTTTTSHTHTGHDHSGHNHAGHDHVYDNCWTTDDEVNGIAEMIKNEAFSDDQSRIGNEAAKNKCMTSAQIKKIASSYTFSEGQVSFLKFAYDNCTDKSNYSTALESLTFSSDKEDVQKYISGR